MSKKTQKNLNNAMESQVMLINGIESQLSISTNRKEPMLDFDVEKSDPVEDREKWSNKFDFFFSGLGYAVGLSNVWRFPYLCYKNGGGAFLFAYYIGVVFCAIPMFFLEVCVGQLTSRGGASTWKISPVFSGVGFSAALMDFYCTLHYVVLIAWSIYYVVYSFRSELPWSTCNNWWNTKNCITPFDHSNEKNFNHSFDSKEIEGMTSSADEFWELNVLRQTSSFDEIGGIRWELLGCLVLSWMAVYFCIFKGIKWTGRVTYFTSTFPFVLLFIMLVRGVTLDGAWDGIKYLFIPDWSRLKSSEVWVEAVTQALYSYGVGLGAVTTLGSYNKLKTNCYRQVLILSFISEATCMVSGLVIFSVLGYMAKVTGKNIQEVANGGPGLAFVAYPSALSQLPFSPVWSVMFFIMLIFVALDGQFVCVEGFLTACTDQWPQLRKRRKSFLLSICLVSLLIGIIFVTNGGIYWFEIFNQYSSAGWAMLTVNFFECVCIAYGYGVSRFYENVKNMIGFYPGRFWYYSWLIFTPGVCLAVFIFSFAKFERLRYENYVYPWYGQTIGLIIAFSSITFIPLYAIYKISTNLGDLKSIVRPKKFNKKLET